MRALFFMGRMARVPGFEKTGGIFPISAKEEIGLGGWTQDGEQQQAIPSLPHYPLLDQLTRVRSARDLITLGANLACNRSTQNVFHLDFKLFS